MADEFVVGKEALSYCTSCRMDLAHIIVSMKGDKIAKVECKTCKKTHAFRKPKGAKEPTKKKKTTRKRKSAEETAAKNVEAEWQRLMDENKEASEKAYNMKGSFQIGDKIGHSKFGNGFVTKLIYPNKMEVIFQTDIKRLIHTGPPAPPPDAPQAN